MVHLPRILVYNDGTLYSTLQAACVTLLKCKPRRAVRRIGEHELRLPPKQMLGGGKPAPATAVCVSHCGNFAFVGTATGRIDRYNMQSGIHRGQYCFVDKSDASGAGATLVSMHELAGHCRVRCCMTEMCRHTC